MAFVTLSELEEREVLPGYRGRFVHTAGMTIVYWTIAAGAPLPEHAHPHEQVAMVSAGSFELTVAGETRVLTPGSVAVIPSGVVHSGRAVTDCRLTDVFQPVREDYRVGRNN